uniref:Suppressor of cytokine signaling 2 n=1 Tax=Helobdella robusta TaxID=6412 RepID=T1FZB8_HELRO
MTNELMKLSSYGWYWGPLSKKAAEAKLSKLADGSFLVRDSSDDRHLLSLSFRSFGQTLHTRIEHYNGMFSDVNVNEVGFKSVVELIENSMSDSKQNGVFCYSRVRSNANSRTFPVCLMRPVSRFSQISTLQHMCRFVLRQRVRLDHIELLPLPHIIRSWLLETAY